MSYLIKSSAVFAALVCAATSASAVEQYSKKIGYQANSNQSAYDNFDVRTRPRPEYAARGARMGSFIAYPSLDIEMLSNDNIGATPDADRSDVGTIISPEFLLKSDFNNHSVEARLYGEMGRFFDETDENFDNYGADVDGRFDVTRDFNVTFGASHGELNEERVSSLANAITNEPIDYSQTTGYIGFNKSFNRVTMQTSVDATRLDYEDGLDRSGNNVDQDVRDLNIFSINGRTAYEISPGYSAFVKGTASRRDYIRDNSSAARDGRGLRGTAGISAELTNLIVGEVEAGYDHREFENYNDFGIFVYGAALNWYPTPLMTGRLTVDRNIIDGVNQTNGANVSGIVQTRYGAQLDYEVLRNFIVTPSAQYIDGDYRGSNDDEQTYIAAISADYMINNHFSLRGSYEYSERDSSVSNLNYDRNLIKLGIRSKL